MIVEVHPVSQTVEIVDGKTSVTVDVVQPSVDVQAVGVQGPKGDKGDTGPMGPAGTAEIGGFPVQMANIVDNDTIIFQSQAWKNTPQSNLTDGGNF